MIDRSRAASTALGVVAALLVLTACGKQTDSWSWQNDGTAPKLQPLQNVPGVAVLNVGILSLATTTQTKPISPSGWWARFDKTNRSLATGAKPCNPEHNGVMVDGVAHNDCDQLNDAPQGIGLFDNPTFKDPITIASGAIWGRNLFLWGCFMKSCSGSLTYSFVNTDVVTGKKFQLGQKITWPRTYNGDPNDLTVEQVII